MNTEESVSAMRETVKHVHRVGELLTGVVQNIMTRAVKHDASKFGPLEFEAFAAETPKLRGLTYGSPEYKAALERLGPALHAHYQNNSHHPEFYKDGIYGMSLFDLIEMLADWKAASERHADGSLARSIVQNAERFKYDERFALMLAKTALHAGWITSIESIEILRAFRVEKT